MTKSSNRQSLRRKVHDDLSFFLRLSDFNDPLDLNLLPSNPNPNASVGFWANNPEDFWSLAPILHIFPEGEFIFGQHVVAWDRNKEVVGTINRLAHLASEANLPFRIYPPSTLQSELWGEEGMRVQLRHESAVIHDFFGKYRLLVGASNTDVFVHPSIVHIPKIVLWDRPFWPGYLPQSGYQNDILFHRLSNLDTIMTTGPCPDALIKPFCPTRIIGSPRLERTQQENKNRRDEGRVVYFPSRYNVNLKETITNLFANLPSGYALTVSLPTYRWVQKQSFVRSEKLSRIEFIFRGEKDLSELIARANVILVEDFEPLLDAYFLGTPIILLDVEFDRMMSWFGLPLLPPANWKSFGETSVSRADSGAILKATNSLGEAISIIEKMQQEQRYQKTRKEIRSLFFVNPPHGAAHEAVNFLRAITLRPRTPESFVARVREHQLETKQSSNLFTELMGRVLPLDTVRRTIIKLLLDL